jgi:uncharacterized membrane protein
MERENKPIPPMQPPAALPGLGATRARRGLGAALAHLRARIIAGLVMVLPFVVTFWIVYWLYTWLDLYAISPMSRLVMRVTTGSRIDVVLEYAAPLVGIALVGILLYFLGFVAHSRIVRVFDNFFLRVPVVTSIYSAASRVFQSLGGEGELSRVKRVVLVPFPHLGMRVPAFVTSSCRDEATGRTILCVYVPTAPMPMSGYLLMVPEEDVIDLNWTLEETLQAMFSFGLTAPPEIQYHGSPRPAAPRVEPVEPKKVEQQN